LAGKMHIRQKEGSMSKQAAEHHRKAGISAVVLNIMARPTGHA